MRVGSVRSGRSPTAPFTRPARTGAGAAGPTGPPPPTGLFRSWPTLRGSSASSSRSSSISGSEAAFPRRCPQSTDADLRTRCARPRPGADEGGSFRSSAGGGGDRRTSERDSQRGVDAIDTRRHRPVDDRSHGPREERLVQREGAMALDREVRRVALRCDPELFEPHRGRGFPPRAATPAPPAPSPATLGSAPASMNTVAPSVHAGSPGAAAATRTSRAAMADASSPSRSMPVAVVHRHVRNLTFVLAPSARSTLRCGS